MSKRIIKDIRDIAPYVFTGIRKTLPIETGVQVVTDPDFGHYLGIGLTDITLSIEPELKERYKHLTRGELPKGTKSFFDRRAIGRGGDVYIRPSTLSEVVRLTGHNIGILSQHPTQRTIQNQGQGTIPPTQLVTVEEERKVAYEFQKLWCEAIAARHPELEDLKPKKYIY